MTEHQDKDILAGLPTDNSIDLVKAEQEHLKENIRDLKDLKIDSRLSAIETYIENHKASHESIINVPNIIIAILSLLFSVLSIYLVNEFNNIHNKIADTNRHVGRLHDRVNNLGLYPVRFYDPLTIINND